jgi:AhpD family alkylhydroperoxidase
MAELLTDAKLAEAVVDGLAGIERCAMCLEAHYQYACREHRKGDGELFAFCSGCLITFQKRHSLAKRSEAERLLRFIAYRGWATDDVFFDRLDLASVRAHMLNDASWRPKWLR